MEFRPILSTLRRHKTAASLIVLEIALSCAIVCNAMFLIGERLERINRPSGIAEIADRARADRRHRQGRRTPVRSRRPTWPRCARCPASRTRPRPTRCRSATAPGTAASTSPRNRRTRTSTRPSTWATCSSLETIGVKLVAGRDFTADDIVDVGGHGQARQQGAAARRDPRRARRPRSCARARTRSASSIYSWGDEPHARGRHRRAHGAAQRQRRLRRAEYAHAAAGARAVHRRRQLPDPHRRSGAAPRPRWMRPRRRC